MKETWYSKELFFDIEGLFGEELDFGVEHIWTGDGLERTSEFVVNFELNEKFWSWNWFLESFASNKLCYGSINFDLSTAISTREDDVNVHLVCSTCTVLWAWLDAEHVLESTWKQLGNEMVFEFDVERSLLGSLSYLKITVLMCRIDWEGLIMKV